MLNFLLENCCPLHLVLVGLPCGHSWYPGPCWKERACDLVWQTSQNTHPSCQKDHFPWKQVDQNLANSVSVSSSMSLGCDIAELWRCLYFYLVSIYPPTCLHTHLQLKAGARDEESSESTVGMLAYSSALNPLHTWPSQ